jgi:tetratricopeptide (TPR) repeat protein
LAQSNAGPAPNDPKDPKAEWTYYGLSKWHIDKRDPERSIPSSEQRDANPIEFGYFLMDVSDLAEFAIQRKNYAESVPYYKTLIKAVPDRAVSYRKVCISYQVLGDWQNALSYCKEALSKEGTFVEDFARYAQIALQMKPNFTSQDGADLDAVAEHLRGQMSSDDTLADEIICDVGLKLQDNNRMKECTARLAVKAPDATKTLTYQWAYALQRGDPAAARKIIDKAKHLPVPPAVIRNLEEGVSKFTRAHRLDWVQNRWVRLGALMLVLLGIFGVSRLTRRRRLVVTTS